MFYNRILRVWVFDQLDYFLISALIGSLIASHLKKYLSEKLAMERLKNSIIKKSDLVILKTPILSSKEVKIKQIYKFALDNRGGQLEEFQADDDFSNEIFHLAQYIKALVERLAAFLKERELKGMLKIFFRNGRLILELILCKCNIGISYGIISEGLSTQVIIITASTGSAAGFALSWFSVGAILITPSLLFSVLLLRSTRQQILNQRDYSKFKSMLKKMLDDDQLKETIQALFMEGEGLAPSSGGLKMKSLDFDEKSALKHNFNLKSDENFGEFIEARMKEELGLIKNPSDGQLQEIIRRKVKRKTKGRTVLFGDFISENPYEGADFLRPDIMDAEIVD
jgi:hypothetical protein